MNKRSVARDVAFLGVMLALVFVFLLVETFLFSALLGNFTPAALTLPLAIAVSVTGDKRNMFIGGTLLGFSSFLLAILIANPIFLNPLVSIAPRFFIGIAAYFVCLLFKKLFKNAESGFLRNVLPYSVAGVAGVLTNTVLVVTMLWIFTSSSLAEVIATILLVNFVAEIISAAVLVPVISRVIRNIYGVGYHEKSDSFEVADEKGETDIENR